LFGKLLVLVYHCFDRIVIQGYLPLLVREEHVVHFFRDVQKTPSGLGWPCFVKGTGETKGKMEKESRAWEAMTV